MLRSPSTSEASRSRKPMRPQSLLFSRAAGWTTSKSKAWAKAHGYRYGKVDVTDQYIRIRQFDPKGSKVQRTVPFGRGIRAVVAREDVNSMATTKEARRRRSRSKKKKPVARKRRRKARRVKTTVRASRPRRRRMKAARRARRAPMVMEAPRKKRRRRRSRRVSAWKRDAAGHAKAARKGWRKRKAKKTVRRRRRKTREMVMEAPRKRRRRSRRRVRAVAESPRRRRKSYRRRSRGVFEASRGGMGIGAMIGAIAASGFGFVIADGVDRLLATYNPSATEKPKDKFTSDGTGSMANTLNIAAMPNWKRLVAGGALTVVPALGAAYIDNKYVKIALGGTAFGAGISLFNTIWKNVLMPMLIGKDTSTPVLQKSYLARLYPAEVAAHINMAARKGADGKTPEGPYSTAGALSGTKDVGPFAVGGDSPYPSTEQALRRQAGTGDYPTTQNTWGTGGDSPYPTAAQALRKEAGMGDAASYTPGPPPGSGPGPKTQGPDPSCGCVGDPTAAYATFLGDSNPE